MTPAAALRRWPVTLAWLAGLALGQALLDPAAFETLPPGVCGFAQALLGGWVHDGAAHFTLNALCIALTGAMVETRWGSAILAALGAASVVAATALELRLAGEGFIGASGAAYGVLAVALGGPAAQNNRWGALGIVSAVVVALEAGAASGVAVYAHIGGFFTGIGFLMFGSLFGGRGPRLESMTSRHLEDVIAIIAETDEDDAAEAREDLIDNDCEGMFVLTDKGRVLGVTGATLEPDTDVAWLSWTYVTEEARGAGHGGMMMNAMLGELAGSRVRKIFIATSDYADEDGPIYADAMELYESFGAAVEAEIPDYHAEGETKIIYGLVNPDANHAIEPVDPAEGVDFDTLVEADESEDALSLEWSLTDGGVSGLDNVRDVMRQQNARAVFCALPDDAARLARIQLSDAGFTEVGRLRDFYAPGLDQVWMRMTG